MSYRDRLRAANERVRLQREDLQRQRAALTGELLALLPAEDVSTLESLQAVLVDGVVTEDDVDEVEAKLEALSGLLAAIAKRIPSLERSLVALPRRLPDDLSQTRMEGTRTFGTFADSGNLGCR